MDYIEKWFISKFRPAINSCILEINADLEKFNVKLFISGGDAMRRYKNDISFTKDIDTKLYINNATGTSDPHKALATRCHWDDPKLPTPRCDVCDTIVTAAIT